MKKYLDDVIIAEEFEAKNGNSKKDQTIVV